MEDRVPARLTPREGRRFAFPVGLAFLALAAVSAWRGHQTPPVVLAALGGGLLVAGTLLPTRLGPVYRGWMRGAHALSRITAPVFLGIVYFLVITPLGLAMRALGRNPLRPRRHGDGFWRAPTPGGRSDLTHQF